jgi:DNA-binding MarR family transcriptional regulator
VRGDNHHATVPLAQLCATTVVVASAPEDTELERLLRQLLLAVVPAAGDPPARNGTAWKGPGPNGAARGGTSRERPARHGAAPDGAIPGRRAGTEAAGTFSDGGAASAAAQLSVSEARALIELVAARGIAQGELAGLLGLEKSTVSRLAAGLERKGWIRRGRDEGNQRYVRLYLTAEGGVVATRVWNAWRSRQARILAALSAEERAGLAAGLRGLVRALSAEGLLGDVLPVPRARSTARGAREHAGVRSPTEVRPTGE